MITVFN